MKEPRPRWLLTCFCGWTTELSSRWAAESAATLHPKLGASDIAHTITIEEPPADPPSGQQITPT